eukprot:TRINITY_DN51_c0_g1_i5.p1 TRINITY_DN51_c0_g1~~TRINITY_DN51_c0_g1_i5.p1  ORF type:complete len:632 (-),score=26.46 TRINITY_DN51_c0_g1_i5:446-2341(-)
MMAALQLWLPLLAALLLIYPVALEASFAAEPTSVSVVKYAHGNFLVPTGSSESSDTAAKTRHLAHEAFTADTPARNTIMSRHKARGSFFAKRHPSDATSRVTEYATLTNKTGYSFRFPGISHYEQYFAGTGYYFGTNNRLEPPDLGMAVGSGYVVQAVNAAIRVYNASSGKPLVDTTPLSQFLNMTYETRIVGAVTNVSRGDFLTDPRVLYDGKAKRWYITMAQIKFYPVSRFKDPALQLVAVSKTSNPLLGFQYYKYNTALEGTLHNTSGPCPCFGDYPQVGFDTNVLTISVNSFTIAGSSFVGSQLYALSKKDLIKGSKTVTAIMYDGTPANDGYIVEGDFANGPAFQIQSATVPPTKTADKRFGGTQYYLSSLYTDLTDSRIGVWALTNTSSLATTSPKTKLSHAVAQLGFNNTLPLYEYTGSTFYAAEQKDGYAPLASSHGESVGRLDTSSGAMMQVVYGSGLVFGASNAQTIHDTAGKNTTYVYWVVVQPTFDSAGSLKSATVKASGRIAIPGLWLSFPAITINAHRAVITFAMSGSTLFPSIGYVYISLKTYKVSDVFFGFEGVEPIDGFTYLKQTTPNKVGRWGDYYAAVSDEKGYFWISGETTPGGLRTSQSNWGSYIVQLPP